MNDIRFKYKVPKSSKCFLCKKKTKKLIPSCFPKIFICTECEVNIIRKKARRRRKI